MTSLNLLRNLRGEIINPHMKFPIVCIPNEMTGICQQKLSNNSKYDHTFEQSSDLTRKNKLHLICFAE